MVPTVILAIALAVGLIMAGHGSVVLIWPVVRERMVMPVAVQIGERDNRRILEARGIREAWSTRQRWAVHISIHVMLTTFASTSSTSGRRRSSVHVMLLLGLLSLLSLLLLLGFSFSLLSLRLLSC